MPGRVTPAAITDLAEATANVLLEAGHESVTYELTGPDPVSSGWASSPTSDLAQLLLRAPASTIEAIRQAAAA